MPNMRKYAKGTTVSVRRTQMDIEDVLVRFGADEFHYTSRKNGAVIGFTYKGAAFQFRLPLPDRDSDQFQKTPTGKRRMASAAHVEWEKECRRKWRSLKAVIKAMLIGVEDGVLNFLEVFMPYLVIGNGITLAQNVLPGVEKAIKSGKMLPSNGLKMLEHKQRDDEHADTD